MPDIFDERFGKFMKIAIDGPAGAGKSTILNLLGGMDKLSSGKIIVDDKRIDLIVDPASLCWCCFCFFALLISHLLPSD